MSEIREIRKKIASFPALPALCQYVLKHLNDPNVDFNKLAAEIKYDPGTTANILKLANSAYYGLPRKVESLQTAIGMLGMKKLFQMVIAGGVSHALSSDLKGYNLAQSELLRHSVWVAVASEELATLVKVHTPGMLFTAGLLHDTGKLILDGFFPASWEKMKIAMDSRDKSFDSIEEKVLGLSHAQAGAELLEKWNFPAELIAAMRWHHAPDGADEQHKILVNIVHMADMLAYTEGIGTGVDGFRYNISGKAIATLGLRTKTIETVASHTLEKMNELEDLLTGGK